MQEAKGSFKAAMFDFDGTITAKGVHFPDEEMVDCLIELGLQMPFSFCTGRQLDSFLRHGMNFLEERLKKSERERFLKNLFFVGENGAIGYFYNLEKEEFESFYEVAWPEEFLARKEFMRTLDEVVGDLGSVIYHAHEIVVVARTKILEFLDHDARNVEAMYELSDKIHEVICDYLKGKDEDYEKYLMVGNSGIGVVVSPTGGNKDRGVVEFGKYLKKERGMEFGEGFREILVAGDRGDVGGNDYYFLNGKYGTAFSVGELVEGKEFPRAVVVDGKRLVHDAGTKWLIREKLLQ